jgi:hypothetical protein
MKAFNLKLAAARDAEAYRKKLEEERRESLAGRNMQGRNNVISSKNWMNRSVPGNKPAMNSNGQVTMTQMRTNVRWRGTS